MKKRGILNHELSDLIARLGHTDTLVIADAGLPVPPGVQRIDLAISGGVPSFMQVAPILEDLAVELVIIASEQRGVSPGFHEELLVCSRDDPCAGSAPYGVQAADAERPRRNPHRGIHLLRQRDPHRRCGVLSSLSHQIVILSGAKNSRLVA